MFEGGHKLRSLVGVVPKPVQQFGKSPLRRVNSAAPLDGLQAFPVSHVRDFGSLALGSVVAPQVILAERPKIFSDRNHRGARGIERDRLHLISWNARLLQDLARGGSERPHVVLMRLGGVFGVFALAVQGVLGDSGFEQASFAIYQRNTST